MKVLFPLFLASALLCGDATAAPLADLLVKADRGEADRERDGRDHPVELLEFAGVKEGMTVADLFAGGGYYSEILSIAVGPTGKVKLINNPPYDSFGEKTLAVRLADGRLKNVSHEVVPTEAMGLADASLDGALMVMSYHDLYWVDEAQGWPKQNADAFLTQVAAALKPGGFLLLVDHSAVEGTGSASAQTEHRIDEAFARADVEGHGLRFDRSLALLRNPADARKASVFDPSIRGKTDRFVHLYRKP